MPTSSDAPRKRSSTRRLSPELASLERRVQQRFQMLRESIRLAEPTRLKAAERRTLQRAILGEALNLGPAEIAAIETSKDGVPASVLLSLMQRYELPVGFFLVEGLPPSPSFLIEQQQRELQGLMTEIRAAAAAIPKARLRPEQEDSPRKGGWLKGLPRTPRTPEQLALRDLWRLAREQGFIPPSLEALVEWGRQNGIEIPEPPPAKTRRPRRRPSAAPRSSKRKSQGRKGGWLKGLPRVAKTAEQEELRRIWREARNQGLRFSNIQDLKAWWAQTQIPSQDPSLVEPVVESAPEPAVKRPAPPRAKKNPRRRSSPAARPEEPGAEENPPGEG